MIVDAISTETPPWNAPSFREDTSSRRAVVTSRTDGRTSGTDVTTATRQLRSQAQLTLRVPTGVSLGM